MPWNQQLDRRLRHALLASVLIFECVTLPRSVHAQTASIQGQLISPASSVSTALGTQSPYLGSVPTGMPTGTVLQLSLNDALDRALPERPGLKI